VVEALITKDYFAKIRQGITFKAVLLLLITPFLHVTWYSGLYYSAERIVQSHAYVCCNICAIWAMLIGWTF